MVAEWEATIFLDSAMISPQVNSAVAGIVFKNLFSLVSEIRLIFLDEMHFKSIWLIPVVGESIYLTFGNRFKNFESIWYFKRTKIAITLG